MKRALLCVIFSILALVLLSACAVFEQEYIRIKSYAPTVQTENETDGKVSVSSFAELKQALLDMAYDGKSEGTIIFDASYSGDSTEDMGSACWQVRTQDALCAYCIENMSYELNKIVTINEATVYISYSDVSEAAGDVLHLPFASGINEIIRNAFSTATDKLVVLITRSSYAAEDMTAAVIRTYRENPALLPKEPTVNVNLYSGNASQKLYEISIDYGVNSEDMASFATQMQSFDAFSGTDMEDIDEITSAFLSANYLCENCVLSEDDSENTAYAALIEKKATCEGIAYAYVELCHRLNLDCRIVYGQRDWQEHCWNIVRIDDKYYHVDISSAIEQEAVQLLFQNDEQMWGRYRWDVSSYPVCISEPLDSELVYDNTEKMTGEGTR